MTPRSSTIRVIRMPTDWTVPMVSPTSITSPMPYWSSMVMKNPARASRMSSRAPKPRVMPTIPTLAISGAILMPTAPSTMMITTVQMDRLTALRSRAPMVSARWARRFLSRPRMTGWAHFIFDELNSA